MSLVLSAKDINELENVTAKNLANSITNRSRADYPTINRAIKKAMQEVT